MSKYCTNCGQSVRQNDRICPSCGNNLALSNKGNHEVSESTSAYALIGFLFPVVGLILYLVWAQERPHDARSAGKGALISVMVASVLVTLASIVFIAQV